MKKSVLKRVISILLGVTLLISMMSGIFHAVAATGLGYWEATTIDYCDKMDADNWSVIRGDTTDNIFFGDGFATLKVGKSKYGRIQAKLPEGARITEVSYNMETKAESYQRSNEAVYDWEDNGTTYNAVGFLGIKAQQGNNFIVGQNQTTTASNSYNGILWNLTYDPACDTLLGTPSAGRLLITPYTVNIKYIYNANDTVDAVFTMGSEYTTVKTGTKTFTNVAPCAILSGGSPALGNETNTYATFSNVTVKYETFVDLETEVNAFRANNPTITVDEVTRANAVEKAQQANKAIEAYNALTNESVKSALEADIANFRLVVERAKSFNTKTYNDNFNNQVLSSSYFETEYLPNNVGGTNTGGNINQTMDYQTNGSVRFFSSGNTGGTKYNKVYRLTSNKSGVGVVSTASFKFFTGVNTGGAVGPLYVYMNDMPIFIIQTVKVKNETTGLYDITSCIVDMYGKAIRNDRRRVTVTADADVTDAGNGLRYTADFSKAHTTDETDPSGWLTFKYVLQDNGFGSCYIYNAAGEQFLYISKTSGYMATSEATGTIDIFDYSDLHGIGFTAGVGSAFSTFSYIDDLQISYDRSESLAAPTLEGSTIAVEADINNQDLQFKAKFDTTKTIPAGYKPVEYGVMMMLSQRMPTDGVLTVEAVGQTGLDLIIGSTTVPEGQSVPAEFTAELGGTSIPDLLGYRFTARAFVIYADANGNRVYVYSGNDTIETAVENGQCSKSVFGVAKAIALAEFAKGSPANAEVSLVAEKATTATPEEKTLLLEYIVANVGVLLAQ